MIKHFRGSLLCLILAQWISSSVHGEEVKTPILSFQPYSFESASGEVVEAELGSLRVPESRSAENSRTLELKFVRFAATGAKPGPPIVYLAGGPGGAGTGAARGGRFPLFMALRQFGDVIAFDQRGTGLSNDIPFCPAPKPYPLAEPLERTKADAWMVDLARHCRGEWQQADIDLSGYTTAESADDIEDLRRALGTEKLRLWGISYGTHLAFSVLRRHPQSVDRVILASSEGPDETVKLPSRTQAFLLHAEKTLGTKFVEGFGRGLDRLVREPVQVPVVDPATGSAATLGVGAMDVQILSGFLIKNPDTLAHLPLLASAVEQGQLEAVAPFLMRLRQQLQGLRGMPEVMDAASGISASRRVRVDAEKGQCVLGDLLNYPADLLAQPLGIEPLPDDFRAPLRSDVPALFLSGSLDGRTYVESHRELAAGFSRGLHIIVEGAGHDLFLSSPEVLQRMQTFLAGDEVDKTPIRVDGF